MRLLNTETLKVEEFFGKSIPKYAILSHTWGPEEVILKDIESGAAALKKGYDKIVQSSVIAKKDGFSFIWIDTCCIDKSSSAELSETINSMFRWYKESAVCYAFLDDVPLTETQLDEKKFRECRWFTRGWTLQELIAPKEVVFFSQDWHRCGTKRTLASVITATSNVDAEVLNDSSNLPTVSIAKRMSWAAKRETTRDEDLAYCLLGIFGVNMPLLYGEGERAFIRLQEEIMKTSTDQTILAWSGSHQPPYIRGALARSPAEFGNAMGIVALDSGPEAYTVTNRGIRVRLPVVPGRVVGSCYDHAVLACRLENSLSKQLSIRLTRISAGGVAVHRRAGAKLENISRDQLKKARMRDIYLAKDDDEAKPTCPRYHMLRVKNVSHKFQIRLLEELSTSGAKLHATELSVPIPRDALEERTAIEFTQHNGDIETKGHPGFVVIFGVLGGLERYSASIEAAFLPHGSQDRKTFLGLLQRRFRSSLREYCQNRVQIRDIKDKSLGVITASVSWETFMGLEVLVADVKYSSHDFRDILVFIIIISLIFSAFSFFMSFFGYNVRDFVTKEKWMDAWMDAVLALLVFVAAVVILLDDDIRVRSVIRAFRG